MRRMYQTEWQGIRFADIAPVSSTRLAGAEFYERFYAEMFKRYPDWNALDPGCRACRVERHIEAVRLEGGEHGGNSAGRLG